MQVQLFKKLGKYTDNKDGKEKNYTNFYVRCGDCLIPIEPCFFPNKETGKDPQFVGRKEVMKAFAAELPERDKPSDSSASSDKGDRKPHLQSFDDDSDIPF